MVSPIRHPQMDILRTSFKSRVSDKDSLEGILSGFGNGLTYSFMPFSVISFYPSPS